MPRSRSTSSLRLFFSAEERNISVTQVLFQSNFCSGSLAVTICITAYKFTPQTLQNFKSSLCVEPHCGQNIQPPNQISLTLHERAKLHSLLRSHNTRNNAESVG